MNETGSKQRLLISYLTLRRGIGILGVALPVLLVVGCRVFGPCTSVLESISDYYGTVMRDVFVGVLFGIGLFLFSYKGYERKDDVAGHVACLCAIGVALFPATSATSAIRILHFLFAAGLFVTLSYFSLFLFTKTGATVTPRKRIRNRVYVVCGVIMLACIAGVAVYYAFLRGTSIAALKPVFLLESLALWAFGLSWFVKGETLWRDT
jgi:hypothetical protein